MTESPSRLPWRHTWPEKGPDFTAKLDLPDGRHGWTRMFAGVSHNPDRAWQWSAMVGNLNTHGGARGKQACADAATKAFWELERRDRLYKDFSGDEPFTVDLSRDDAYLADMLFLIRERWGERLYYGKAPEHVAAAEAAIVAETERRKRGEDDGGTPVS